MKLTHEFNEYVVGLVVTDEETGRSVNFQYEQIESNHPTPDYVLTWGCEGDDTYNTFNEDELEVISDYVKSLDNRETLEKEMTELIGENEKYYEDAREQTGRRTYKRYTNLYDDDFNLTRTVDGTIAVQDLTRVVREKDKGQTALLAYNLINLNNGFYKVEKDEDTTASLIAMASNIE